MTKKQAETLEPLKINPRCNRCGYRYWQDENGKYHCTNPKCVKYKPQPSE